MRKLIAILIIIVLFFGCKQDNKQLEINSEKRTENRGEIGEIEPTKIDSLELPKSIQYNGFIKNAIRWDDKLGKNIVILTETGIFRSEKIKHESEDSNDAALYGYHFIIKNNEAVQTWKVYDYVNDCSVDIVTSFIENTLKITDLNKNGIAEVWLMYKTACHGDVSPSEMKIIMYEGSNKFAIRGENRVQIGIDDDNEKIFIGGEYKVDDAFENGPKVFKVFAQNLWNKKEIENSNN